MRKKLISVVLLILIVCQAMPVTISAGPPVTRDTVLVLDASGSMSGTKLTTLKNAAIEFCQHILAADGINRIAIVVYANHADSFDFTDNLSDLTDYINDIHPFGGTNINEAIEKADDLLKSSSASIKNIVLMTDGIPNYGDSSTNGKYSYDDSHNYYHYANTVYKTAVALHGDYRIYTLGFLYGMNSSDKVFAARLLKDIQNAGYYEADDPEDLEKFFDEIAKKILDDDGGLHNYRERQFFFPLPILPPNFNHSNLNFSTNGGAAIDPITLPTGTTVQLSQYIPLRDGYEFVGWCRDAALTRTITKVQVIDPNTVVYAKWSPIW